MKKGIVVGVIILVVIAAGILAGTMLFSGKVVSNLPSSNSNSSATSPSTSGNPASSVKEFTMTAQNFAFDPGIITVNQGDTVILHITSTDVAHGIAIPQFGVSQQLPVGQEETVQFVADQKGNFTFFCNVFCGEGHRGMKGVLVVN